MRRVVLLARIRIRTIGYFDKLKSWIVVKFANISANTLYSTPNHLDLDNNTMK